MNKTLNIGLCGASGKMGNIIRTRLDYHDNCRINGEFNTTNSPKDMAQLFANNDVIIDFSASSLLESLLENAKNYGKKLVIGTTGYNEKQFDLIEQYSKDIAILYSANMSLGVTLLTYLLAIAAKNLPSEFDAEILEIHQRNKKDAPSGTALMLGRVIAQAREIDFKTTIRSNVAQGLSTPQGSFPQKSNSLQALLPNQIGFASIRGGHMLAEHNVMFAGDHEVIAISHKSLDRAGLADGAIKSALWIKDQPAGLYSMHNIYQFEK